MNREEELKQLISDFKATFTVYEPGIRVLRYLSKFCLENSETFVEESARKSDFNCGARSVILEIRRKINTSEEPKQTEAVNKEKE